MVKSKNTSNMPDNEIEKMARCLLPSILAFFESAEGQQEFERLQQEQQKQQAQQNG